MVRDFIENRAQRAPRPYSIRDGVTSDVDFVRSLSGLVFSIYGSYDVLLPRWMSFPEVTTIVAVGRKPLGFAMFAPIPFTAEEDECFADVLAIAVHPSHHRLGVGRTLLHEVIERVERTSDEDRVTAIRLTVADTNLGARRLFEQCGFTMLDSERGRYDGGQIALRMERPILPRG